jgi:hypothetical protein
MRRSRGRGGDHVARERVFEMKRQLFKAFESAEGCVFDAGRTQWADIVNSFGHLESFKALSDFERLDVLEDFMMDSLERKRDESRRLRQREARRKRDRFLALLESHRDDIASDIGWPEFVARIKSTPEYRDLIGTKSSSQPYDLFAEMRSKWKRECAPKRERSNSQDSVQFSTKRQK